MAELKLVMEAAKIECNTQHYDEEVCGMEKYVKAEMEIIEFEAEDVITTSGCNGVDTSVNDWGNGGSLGGGELEED